MEQIAKFLMLTVVGFTGAMERLSIARLGGIPQQRDRMRVVRATVVAFMGAMEQLPIARLAKIARKEVGICLLIIVGAVVVAFMGAMEQLSSARFAGIRQ